MATYVYPRATGVYGRTPSMGATYTYTNPVAGTEGDLQSNLLPSLRNLAMSDYGARVGGARRAAMDSNPDLTGYAGLNALLTGQGDASRSLSTASSGALMDRLKRQRELTDMANRQAWEEKMARLYHQWQMEQQRSANNAQLWGSVLNAAGTVAGAGL